jgi:quinolinate synthase
VIKFADYTGDSFRLARQIAERSDAEFIVFCGVHFMAESADVLCAPHQQVILPTSPPAARWRIWLPTISSRSAGRSSLRWA